MDNLISDEMSAAKSKGEISNLKSELEDIDFKEIIRKIIRKKKNLNKKL